MTAALPPLANAGASPARAAVTRVTPLAAGFEAALRRADKEPRRGSTEDGAAPVIAPAGGVFAAAPTPGGTHETIAPPKERTARPEAIAARVDTPDGASRAAPRLSPSPRAPAARSAAGDAVRAGPEGRTPPDAAAPESVRRPPEPAQTAPSHRPRVESAQASRFLPPPEPAPASAETALALAMASREDNAAAPLAQTPTPALAIPDEPAPRRPFVAPTHAASEARPIPQAAASAPPPRALRLEIAGSGPDAVSVSVGMRLRADALDLSLRVADAQDAAAIERHAPALVERLREAGYALDRIVIERRDAAMDANGTPEREAGGEGARPTPHRRTKDEAMPDGPPRRPERGDGVYL